VFQYLRDKAYRGFFLKGDVIPVDQFRTEHLQDADALLPNGGRRNGQSYVSNFFFPRHLDGGRS
jgi:hypothetical protein